MGHPRFGLLLRDWPAGDQAAWVNARRVADIFDDPGLASHWRQKTSDTVLRNYSIWLAWLREAGRLTADCSPAARAARETLGAFHDWLRARSLSPVTIAGRVRNLREALRVMDPDGDRSAIDHLLVRVEAVAEPVRNKGVRVVSPSLLTQVGIDRMCKYRPSPKRPASRVDAERHRDGLIIAFLAARPIRLENLAALELGRHLERRADAYWCRISAEETKDRRDLEFPLPTTLTSHIDVYLSTHRPALLRGGTSARVWISMRGTPMVDNSIYCRVVVVTRAALGRPINPHLFRDCAATFIAERAPAQVHMIASILGHASLESGERHYNQAGMLSAQAHWIETLAKLRDEPQAEELR